MSGLALLTALKVCMFSIPQCHLVTDLGLRHVLIANRSLERLEVRA